MRHIALAMSLVTILVSSSTVAQEADTSESDAKFASIAERYHALVLRQPRRGAAFDMLVRHYLDAGRLDELVTRLEKHAADTPGDAAGQLALGLVYERRGRDAEALKAFARAGELAPGDFYADFCRGLVLAEQRADDAAIAAFRARAHRRDGAACGRAVL